MVEDEIHSRMLSLSVDSTGKGRYFLFNKYFDPTVRLNDIRKASRQCCMPAINTSSLPTSVAVMLFRVHWFVTNEARCAFVGARLYHICGFGSCRVRKRGSSDPQPHTLHCLVA